MKNYYASLNVVQEPLKRLPALKKPVATLGYWSAIVSLILGWGYSVSQLMSWMEVITYPTDQYYLFAPSLLLAPSFLITICCLHYIVPEKRKIFTAVAGAFATVYCAFATLTYFVQLTIVVPGVVNKTIAETSAFIFKPGSFMFAMDCLGYFFMSLSTLFAAFAFRAIHKSVFFWMLANGLLLVLLIPAYFYPVLYYFSSVWIITFSMSMIKAARSFKVVNHASLFM